MNKFILRRKANRSTATKQNYVQLIFLLMSWMLFSGQSVIVEWNQNSEADLAGYRVYWGRESRHYTQWRDVGKDTSCVIENLESDDYFFTVTAYDTAGNESRFSEEVHFRVNYQPDVKPGIANDDRAYNFPNPFNPDREKTAIRYVLPQLTKVSIQIYDVNDKLVRVLLPPIRKLAGEHFEDVWDGKNEQGVAVPNGVYFAVIRYDFVVKVVTMAVVR
ncbi:hypothetical protein B6D60_07190 [candidate division KSB1 bacterium 4484_87]|nr:MAG: hypothetical protein B6D60_07190 [candidate division KSB1 bacterium 4484_87]